MAGGGGITNGIRKEHTVKAIGKLVGKLKRWAADLAHDHDIYDQVSTLRRREQQYWNELASFDNAGNSAGNSATASRDAVEQVLRLTLLCQQNRMALRLSAFADTFSPQLNAVPAMLRSALELAGGKPAMEQAMLHRFLDSATDKEATDSGIDLVAALCGKDTEHPLDPEINAIRVEMARVDGEISKLRDAGYYRDELKRKQEKLAQERQERTSRSEAEVMVTNTLVQVTHYQAMRDQLVGLEAMVARSADFAALDLHLGELVGIEKLPEWRDGSAGSLGDLVATVQRQAAFAELVDASGDADAPKVMAAVLNVHASTRPNHNPKARFTVSPEGVVIGVWSLPEALRPNSQPVTQG